MDFKLLNEEVIWKELLKNKYLHSKSIPQVQAKPNDSVFWKGLMRVKNEFFERGIFKVNNGVNMRFWEAG
jgi:hypothetical protein